MTWIQALSLAVTILIPAVLGLVGWVWTLWQSHHALRLKVAEEYPKTQSLDEMKRDIRELRTVVFKIAQRMDITVLAEP